MDDEKMFILVILNILCFALVAGDGIVNTAMPDGDGRNDEIEVYSFKLMCDYQHFFKKRNKETTLEAPWSYVLECREIMKGDSDPKKKLVVKYDMTWLETFDVTSCSQNDVIESVFPPTQINTYATEPDTLGRPTVSYLKYKNKEGKCFVRKYKFQLNHAMEGKRFEPQEKDCGDTETVKFATFDNCIQPEIPVNYIVKDWAANVPEWTESDEMAEKLECYYNHVNRYFHLKCVQASNGAYKAVVKYKSHILDIFTVTSCAENDIVNGIFPRKSVVNDIEVRFGFVEKRCYRRLYPNYMESTPTLIEAEDLICPTSPDAWVNPTSGETGQWYLCTGPESNREKSKTRGAQETQVEVENGQQQDGPAKQ